MNDALQIARRLNEAFDSKDAESIRNLLHPDYNCLGPDIEYHGPEELIAASQSMPFACHSENVEYAAAGNKVIMTCDWVSIVPVSFRIRMCDIMTVEDGKVRSEELFYDTAKFPKEAVELMKQALPRYRKAA